MQVWAGEIRLPPRQARPLSGHFLRHAVHHRTDAVFSFSEQSSLRAVAPPPAKIKHCLPVFATSILPTYSTAARS